MKYRPLLVIVLTLAPCLVDAQNQQSSDCRTLEMAGNFIAADETLVDGLVCKVGKPEASAVSRPAAGKTAEGSKALLGIIEPEILRAKEKARANPEGGEATPGAAGGSLPGDSRADGAAPSSSFFTSPKQSLGEIARAFRKAAGVEITTQPEQGEASKPGPDEADRGAMLAERDKPPAATVTEPLHAQTSEPSSLSEPQAKAGKMATAPQNEVIAVPAAQPSPVAEESNPDAARNKAASEPATRLPAIDAKSLSAPDVQAPMPAATPAAAQKTSTSEAILASPESLRIADAPAAKPQPWSRAPIVSPRASGETGSRAELQANAMEEDAPFREGQASNCSKNVSLGSMDKDKLFLAIPDWALKWYEKNQKRFPRICFSNSLMPGAKNYLVVFYTASPDELGTESRAKVSSLGDTTSAGGMGGFTASYGSTWHYTFERKVTTTIVSVSAEKAPHNQPSTLLDATAYAEEGTPVSHHSATPGTKRAKETYNRAKGPEVELPDFRVMEELLGRMMEDIAKL